MMSCRLEAIMVLALCALAQSVSSKLIKNDPLDPKFSNKPGKSELPVSNEAIFVNLTALVSILPSENGSAEIVSSDLTMSGEDPCLFTIIVDEIKNCDKSSETSVLCKSQNKGPELHVTLVAVVNYEKTFTYTTNVTGGALLLTISMENTLVVVPKYFPGVRNSTIYLDFMFESFQGIEKSANSTNVFMNVQTTYTPTSPPSTSPVNGRSGLCPLNGTVLLMLFAICLFI
ncbi:uncharacterized protein [Phyllobates terribilis]|uniref:uncharacterized protein n=1 Tax=Phyllobates terribilis TaxID=111132 RepID=UPI003CCA7677